MKKIFNFCISISLLFVVTPLWSQYTLHSSRDSVGNSGNVGSIIDVGVPLKCISASAVNARWVKIMKSWPAEWSVETCDLQNCYPPDVDSVAFSVNPNDSGFFLVHFSAMTTEGTGKLKLLVYDLTQARNKGVTLTFTATATKVGINNTLSTSNCLMYPNPALDKLYFKFDKAENCQIDILDLSGRVLANCKITQSSTGVIDISGLPQGFYMARIETSSGLPRMMNFTKE